MIHLCFMKKTYCSLDIPMLCAHQATCIKNHPFESHKFCFLCAILLKLHFLIPLIESFPTVYSLWSSIEKRFHSRCTCFPYACWSIGIENYPFKSRNFVVLCPVLLKLHISAQLIGSYPTVHGLWSCIKEKLSFCSYVRCFTLITWAINSIFVPKLSKAVISVWSPVLLKLYI